MNVATSPMPSPQTDIHSSRVLILDFGAQYTQLIARRVREHGVYCEILPWDITNDDVRKWKPKGIILSGGPESVTDSEPPRAPQVVFELGVPVLGICYGMQTMAQQLGGKVLPSNHREFGYAEVTATAPNKLLDGLSDRKRRAGPRRARRVDEPRRSRRVAAAGLHGRRAAAPTRRSPPWSTSRGGSTPCSSIPKSRTRCRASSCSSASCARSAAASRCGASATSSKTPSRACARRWARARCCSAFRAASIPRWSRRCCTRPSATSSPACSSITASCASTKATRS